MDEKQKQDAQNLVEQFQAYQQQLQNILIQKEGLKLQALEVDRALDELSKTKQTSAYKISGQIMIAKSVVDLKKELEETKENLSIRLGSMDKTEIRVGDKLKELQDKLKDVMK
jgi:prefoldin beta subunit